MYKFAFANKDDIVNYCNNYVYNWVEPGELPDDQLYNVTLILLTRYKKITHFAELNLYTN